MKNILANYIIGIFWLLFVLVKFRPKIIIAADILSQRIVSFLSPLIENSNIFMASYGSEIITNYNEKGIKGALFTLIYKKAKKIIAISSYTKGLLIKRNISEDKIIIVNPGLDSKWFSDKSNHISIREKLGLKNSFVILTVARLSERKGHDLVISIMPRLLSEIKNIKYIIVGDGEDRIRLKELAYKNHLENEIIFAGRVKDEDLIDYYDLCDIFIMPSKEIGNLTEGFGISFIEAGARGKPAIGMRTGGVEDAIIDGQTGYLVEPDDVEGFTSRIIYLLKNKEVANQLGNNARNYISNKFYWKDEADSILCKTFR